MKSFEKHLYEREKSEATVKKYLRDVAVFLSYADGRGIDRQLLLEYKAYLSKTYAVASANSMIASLNAYLKFIGRTELSMRQFRVQKKVFCSETQELTRAEYTRLVNACKNTRLELVIKTICATGIRVSELRFITVEAVRQGEATVTCKGKTRTVFIVNKLRRQLLEYIKRNGITDGAVFVTKSGRPIDRSNIWRDMKALCKGADVLPSKVFPHNLRHLFARTFYSIEKDIAKLADILGHSDINTTRIYIITTHSEHKKRMESMHLIM